MRNHFFYFILTLAVLSFGHSLAQVAVIKGRVLNASRDSTAVSGQSIALQIFKQDFKEPKEYSSVRTGADGQFVVKVADLDTSAHYIVATEHQGVRYYSEVVHFIEPATMTRTITVFDSTHSNLTAVALMHHLFVQNTGTALAIRESRILNNPSNKTIIQAIADEHESDAIFRFGLPSAAQNIEPIAGHFSNDLKVHGRVVYDCGVFEPGNRQVSYAYELPWQNNIANFDLQFDQATRSFDIFLADEDITIQGGNLTDFGPFSIRGTSYHRYGVQNLQVGNRIAIRMLGKASESEVSSPVLLLIAMSTLLIAGILVAAARRNKEKPVLSGETRTKLQQSRKTLIEKIAQIELELQTRPDPELQQKRQDLFDQLHKIEWSLQQGKTSNKTVKK